jgi:hypothetical protein
MILRYPLRYPFEIVFPEVHAEAPELCGILSCQMDTVQKYYCSAFQDVLGCGAVVTKASESGRSEELRPEGWALGRMELVAQPATS